MLRDGLNFLIASGSHQPMTQPTYSLISIRSTLTLTLTIVCIVALGAPLAHGATRITQHGITWTFDRDYPTGQFANGDYWVVGPVKIVQITPRSDTSRGAVMHGSMVNPRPNSSQGYDSRIKNNRFEAAKNVAAHLPLVLPAGSSLLSSESYLPHAKGDHPQLRTIAILTVLAAPAPAGSFRPPYVGTDKSLRWNQSQLRYDRLRSLPRVAHAPRPSAVAARFERPWIEQGTSWVARYLHPGDNQPTYGREIAHALAEGLLALQLDYPNRDKEKLLVRLVQYGIDVYGAARSGAVWNADGGHNHGRKMPLLLAGAVLGDADILAYGDGRKMIFQEDQQIWYVTPSDVGRVLLTADKRRRDLYLPSDVGIPEWGEKHHVDPRRDGRNWDAYYRTVAGSSTIGSVLVARLMNLEKEWNWPAVFDYYDRYWAKESRNAGSGVNSIQRFVAEMWKAYRHSKPAEITEKSVATEVWENTPIEPQSRTFSIAFDLLASGNRVNGITGLSRGAPDNYNDLAASVRFAPSGIIDARNGGTFQAVNRFRYAAGVRYRVLMTIDVAARRYSVSVAAPGASPVLIADRWKFRTQQKSVARLDHLGYFSASGYHAVMDVSVQPKPLLTALALLGEN